jgi:tetratricopeptide (TPR) repeat protein
MRRHLTGLLERAAVLEIGRDARAAEGVVADLRCDAGRPGATAHHSPSIVSVEPLTIELRLPTTIRAPFDGLEQGYPPGPRPSAHTRCIRRGSPRACGGRASRGTCRLSRGAAPRGDAVGFARYEESERLKRRALAIDEKSYGPEHPTIAIDLNTLAVLLKDTYRLAEAEPLMRRALTIDEKSYGPQHPAVGRDLGNLAQLLQATNRFAEAEPLYRRALAIDETCYGPEYPCVAADLNNLAVLLQADNQLTEAEPLMRRALSIDENGPEHPNVAARLNGLALMRAELGDWEDAAALGRRARPILIAHKGEGVSDRSGLTRSKLTANSLVFRFHARVVHRAGPDHPAACEEGFELGQWALQTSAADALSQMSVRFAKGEGSLASLVRERQDLIVSRLGEMQRVDTRHRSR